MNNIVEAVQHLTAVQKYATASYALAIYEYAITLDREVSTFWKRKFTLVTVLWFFNRYTLLFSLFPTLLGFYFPYTQEYPGAMQIISNIASGITLSIRVYALYGQAWWIIAVLLPLLITEIAVESWAVAGGVAVVLPKGLTACILTGKENEGIKFAAFWTGQLVFPTLIFVMTIARVLRLKRIVATKDSLLTLMLRDGIMYFLVIFIANTTNVITYIVATEDLKFANAPFTNVITTLMICRLMLNLQQSGESPASEQTDLLTSTLDRDIFRPTLLGTLEDDISVAETRIDRLQQDKTLSNWETRGGDSGIGQKTPVVVSSCTSTSSLDSCNV